MITWFDGLILICISNTIFEVHWFIRTNKCLSLKDRNIHARKRPCVYVNTYENINCKEKGRCFDYVVALLIFTRIYFSLKIIEHSSPPLLYTGTSKLLGTSPWRWPQRRWPKRWCKPVILPGWKPENSSCNLFTKINKKLIYRQKRQCVLFSLET